MIPDYIKFLIVTICSLLIVVILISSIIKTYLDNRKFYNFSLLNLFISSLPILIIVFSIFFFPIYHLRQISVYIPEIAFLFGIGLFYIPTILRRFFEKNIKPFPRKKKNLKILIIMVSMFFFTINSINIYGYYIVDTKEDWRGAVNYIHENTNQSDIIILHSMFVSKPFNYYYLENATVLGIDNFSQLEPLIPSYDKIWIIFSHSRAEKDIKNYMISITNILTSKIFRGIEIIKYQLK